MDPTFSQSLFEPYAKVRVVAGLSGEELLCVPCRCRYDIAAAAASRLGAWPAEQRLLLQNGKLWTEPALPVEMGTLELTVQLVRVPHMRSILPPKELRWAVLVRLAELSPTVRIEAVCRDLGEPAGIVFYNMVEGLLNISHQCLARALLLRRRMDELLPMTEYDYNAATVFNVVLRDHALWNDLRCVSKASAKKFLTSLGQRGIIDLSALSMPPRTRRWLGSNQAASGMRFEASLPA